MLLDFCKMEENYSKLMHLNDNFYHFSGNMGWNGPVEDQAKALEHVLFQTLTVGTGSGDWKRVPLRWGSAFLSQLPSLPRDLCPCGPASSPLNHLLEVSKGLTVWGKWHGNLFYISGMHQINCETKQISSPCSLFLSLLVDPQTALRWCESPCQHTPVANGTINDGELLLQTHWKGRVIPFFISCQVKRAKLRRCNRPAISPSILERSFLYFLYSLNKNIPVGGISYQQYKVKPGPFYRTASHLQGWHWWRLEQSLGTSLSKPFWRKAGAVCRFSHCKGRSPVSDTPTADALGLTTSMYRVTRATPKLPVPLSSPKYPVCRNREWMMQK